MESWFEDARRIDSLEAEICFPLQKERYVRLPQIPRRVPLLLRTSEAVGNENELIEYYRDVIRRAFEYGESFGSVRSYFWLRLWIWNTENEAHIGFPWYDTYSEIEKFFDGISIEQQGLVFSDTDQSWEIEVHNFDGSLFIRLRDADENETREIIRCPRNALLNQLPVLRNRATSIIRTLTSQLGRDLWSTYVEWPEFKDECKNFAGRRRWWKLW